MHVYARKMMLNVFASYFTCCGMCVNPAHYKEFPILSLTCTGLRRGEGATRVASVSWAAALTLPALRVVLAVITDTSTGATCGAPHSLREVTALCVAMTFTL